jgi:glycine/D-amino acid oxidase-like deaminating enzyme
VGSYDVIVVGGGIIGLSIAYHLALRRVGRVALLERSHLGAGSTGLSVASIEPLGRFPALAAIHARSITTFKNFSAEIGGECGFVALPLAMFVTEADLPTMREITAYAQAAGSDARLLSPGEFHALYPDSNLDGVAAVYYSQDAGHADPVLTLNSYADAARNLGVVIRQNTPVLSVRVDGGHVVGVETTGGLVSASVVVLAAGLWIEALLKPLGLSASLHLHRHFVVCIEAPTAAPHLSIIDSPLEYYARPEKSGNLYLLGGAGYFPACANPDERAPGVTTELCYAYLEKFARRFPVMEEARLRVSTGYTGIADMTPDTQPLLGALPLEGLYLAAGMSGIGFKMSPGIGQAMAGLIAGDDEASQLLYPLRPTRFTDGQPLSAASTVVIP